MLTYTDSAAILTLHRYFIWANRMRTHFDDLLKEKQRLKGWEVEANLYMSYWYGGLYVVVEGWRELKLSDAAIDQLLSSRNADLLRRYRNGVFHFQKKYYDERFTALIRDGEDVVDWVRTLNREFGRFFLNWHAQVQSLGT